MINLKESQTLECQKKLKKFSRSFVLLTVLIEFPWSSRTRLKRDRWTKFAQKWKLRKAHIAHGRYKICDKNSTKEIGFEILNRFPWNWLQNLTIKTATKETVESYCISKIEVCKILRLNYFRKTPFKQLRFSKYYVIFGMAAMPLPL